MDVGRRERYRERDALAVGNNVALRARFASIRRVLADLLAPLLAATLAESSEALDQSISSAFPSRSSKTRCNSRHTPASSQSRRRRQHLEALPQPISWGSISHGMPLLSTKTMPVSAAGFGTRGRPPFGLGGSGGSSGSTISHNSSVISSLPMTRSVASDRGGFARCSKTECQVKLRAAQVGADTGLVFDAGTLTLGAYLGCVKEDGTATGWLLSIKDTVRQRTWERYESVIRVHIKPTIGSV